MLGTPEYQHINLDSSNRKGVLKKYKFNAFFTDGDVE